MQNQWQLFLLRTPVSFADINSVCTSAGGSGVAFISEDNARAQLVGINSCVSSSEIAWTPISMEGTTPCWYYARGQFIQPRACNFQAHPGCLSGGPGGLPNNSTMVPIPMEDETSSDEPSSFEHCRWRSPHGSCGHEVDVS